MTVSELHSHRRNRILGALPPNEMDAVSRDLNRTSLQRGDTIYEADSTLEAVYFPVGCALSMVKLMANGSAVEVGTIGREGMAGIHAVLGGEVVPDRCTTQISGAAYCTSIEAFRKHFQDLPAFARLLRLYAQIVFSTMAQSVACNRLHSINERCARWLLMTRDRIGRDSFDLTQEFLATMLGANRPSVSIAASTLQQAGLITYKRGLITILDNTGLENVSCECYGVTARQLEEALPLNETGRGST
jgi:CRP-like cAMP-binding protein